MTQPGLTHIVAGRKELMAAIRANAGAIAVVGLVSVAVNLLYLTGSLFMLQVYDRAIPSHSVPTLVGLCIIAAALYVFQGGFEIIRSRLLVRVASSFDAAMAQRVYAIMLQLPLKAGKTADGAQPLRDLDQIRTFLSGSGPTALFDLPWMPAYVAICYLFHPAIGFAALGGAVMLVMLMVATEIVTRRATAEMTRSAAERLGTAESARRNAEAVQAMGMLPNLSARWLSANRTFRDSQQRSADITALLGTLSKVARMALQSGVLGLGAYLVIMQQASGGIIIASSILSSRALAPVELVIANWRPFVAMRQSWNRLANLLGALPAIATPMALPAPRAMLEAEGLVVGAPGTGRAIVQDASFLIEAGQAVAIIGPSASGKSTLTRAIAGIWSPLRGKVMLDRAALDQWSAEALGMHVGYLPQEIELFGGTIEQNIARFAADPDPRAVIAAARLAGVHDMILGFPHGYRTSIGEAGSLLSAGQRQRLALARALYGDPFLLILDEPNSNLDHAGEDALTQAIVAVKARGGIVVIVAHRHNMLAAADLVIAMSDGRIAAFGPRDETLAKVLRQSRGPEPARPLRPVPRAAVGVAS